MPNVDDRFRESEAARTGAARFVDLDYRALVADPIGAVHQVYETAELDLGPDLVASFERHCGANRQHARGAHRYTPEQFGLDRGALRERFARYEARFGLRDAAGASRGRG